MLRENVQNIDAVLFTHHHKDHVAGMMMGEHLTINGKKDIEVYCSKRTSKALHMEFPYVFTKKYPGPYEVNINIIDYKPFEINNIRIIPIDVLHYKMQVFGYRIMILFI